MHGETEETTTLTLTVIDPKRAEEQSQAHIHFLECMDQVNRVIQQSDDFEQMLWKVLEKVFAIFGCDRIWLLDPCDPEAPTYRIPVEVTRPEYPGAHDLNQEIPMKPGGDKFCTAALATAGAVQYNSSSGPPIFSELTEQFGVLSQMSVAIYPKIGKPWMLGMHQCSCERVWTEAEQRLFEEIGRRIGDGLNTLLLLRDLRESERRYRELADLLPQTVCELDTKGDITFGNRHGFALFGYPPNDLVKGFNVAQIIAPQDRERMLATVHDRMSGIEGKESEFLGLRRDGSSFPTLVYSTPIERNDEIIGIRCLFIDITDHKQVEEELKQHRDRLEELVDERTTALRQSEQRLALAMDAANDGLWDFNPQTGETYFSPRWYGILGYIPDEMPPSYQTFTDLIHPEDRAETLAYIERHIASGEPFSCEFRMRQKNGGYLWVLDRGQTMEWDEQDRPLRLIGMHTDISDRKQVEEDLKEANRELEAFAYTVSHDLRTPLVPIIGYADFMRESCRDRLNEQELECLSEISVSGHKMAALMEALLALAKAGQVERPAVPFDVEEVVNEMVYGLTEIITQAGVSVNVGSLPTLRAPRTLLVQIFDNLIGNAIRYGCKPGDVIEVGGERKGQKVRLFVRDYGPGVPAEERDRIFEVFYRGTAGKDKKGTGIGLATVQKIARLFDGRAWVEETPGGGSTFWVEVVDVPASDLVK
jgi:PAS domain S-box-containing protein